MIEKSSNLPSVVMFGSLHTYTNCKFTVLLRFYCRVCEMDFDFQCKLDRHSMSTKHKRRKQMLEDNESISETCMDTPLIDYLGTDFSSLEEVSQ